jgi:hypothetical protein
MLDLYLYLCCLGPDVFSHEKVMRLPLPEKYRALLEEIVREETKGELSRKVGLLLSASLALKGSDARFALAEIGPFILNVDVRCNYDVLKHMCASLPEHVSARCGEVLLSLAIATEKGLRLGRNSPEEILKLRHLVCALSCLKLEAKARSRLFLALVQNIETCEVFQDILLTTLYPDAPQEALECLLLGNNKVASVFMGGARQRPNGKSEFYAVCKAVMEVAPVQGLSVLGRMYYSLARGDGEARGLQAMIRASVFIGIEKVIKNGQDFQEVFGNACPLPALALLTVVLPGIQEPQKTAICEYVLSRVFDSLRSEEIVSDDIHTFAMTIIAATVNHSDPNKAGVIVRGGIMDANGRLQVRLQDGTGSDESRLQHHVFLRIVEEVTRELTRRASTAGILEPIMPILTNSDNRVASEQEVWVA